METVGLAKKVTYPTLALIAIGAVLMVLDLAGIVDVEDEIWITLLGSGGVVFGVGHQAPPTQVVTKADEERDIHEVT